MEKVSLSVQEWAEILRNAPEGDKNFSIQTRVISWSMYPWIRANQDDICVVPVKKENLKVGDIVFFPWISNDGKYCLHRIVKIDGNRVQTFGDHNRMPDEWIDKNVIVGKATVIYRGKIKINCESRFWKFVFKIWVLTAKIRGVMLFPFRVLHKLKKIFRVEK